MGSTATPAGPHIHFLEKQHLGQIIDALRSLEFQVIAPVREQDVIRLRPINSVNDMARGVTDEQDLGWYRLVDDDVDTYFEHAVGLDSAKRWFFPPQQQLFAMHVAGERFVIDEVPKAPPKLAFIGLRACDLAAIAVQDRVFGVAQGQQTFRCESEGYYRQAREQAFIVAVNCTRPGGNCFCDAWQTGPQVREGYDLALTELRSGFVLRAGSKSGEQLLAGLTLRQPTGAELELEELKLQRAREHMGRQFDATGVAKMLSETVDHPQWDRMAERCLGCGNCTMVCPTCFCSTVYDSNELGGNQIKRTQVWESCFTHQFSYTTAGPVRSSIRARYRHWLRHKLSTWWKQFNTSGCVGCGRCITWCPVGIDLTQVIGEMRRWQIHHTGETHNSTQGVAT